MTQESRIKTLHRKEKERADCNFQSFLACQKENSLLEAEIKRLNEALDVAGSILFKVEEELNVNPNYFATWYAVYEARFEISRIMEGS